MRPIQAMSAEKFLEIVADLYFRDSKRRVRRSKIPLLDAPCTQEASEGYFNHFFRSSFTSHQSSIDRNVPQQLFDAVLSGSIRTYRWPLLVVDDHPDVRGIEAGEDVILLKDVRKWVKENGLLACEDLVTRIMKATQPKGDTIQVETVMLPRVQLREKAIRKPKIPTQVQLDEYDKKFPFAENVGKHAACHNLADWLKSSGYFKSITGRTLETWLIWNNATLKLELAPKAKTRLVENS